MFTRPSCTLKESTAAGMSEVSRIAAQRQSMCGRELCRSCNDQL